MKWQRGDFWISDDKSDLDVDVIHGFLHGAYWCAGVSRGIVEKSLQNSLCLSVHDGDSLVGFCRAVTDYASFAYLADVFIIENYRGQGLGKWLVHTIVTHPQLQGFRRWLLATKDAHGLYRSLGFAPLKNQELFMEKHRPDIYING